MEAVKYKSIHTNEMRLGDKYTVVYKKTFGSPDDLLNSGMKVFCIFSEICFYAFVEFVQNRWEIMT